MQQQQQQQRNRLLHFQIFGVNVSELQQIFIWVFAMLTYTPLSLWLALAFSVGGLITCIPAMICWIGLLVCAIVGVGSSLFLENLSSSEFPNSVYINTTGFNPTYPEPLPTEVSISAKTHKSVPETPEVHHLTQLKKLVTNESKKPSSGEIPKGSAAALAQAEARQEFEKQAIGGVIKDGPAIKTNRHQETRRVYAKES
ncbi:8759_t:CDS:2 [Ambispora gerdemannii]|uniref:8759_t:CDS:1 n=1 Tax=Ambispora gerdemannii TaxID=144530 RepID=A0A9N9GX41_9GLOM|nr:8759_t:CDS:2 [Ambispora gerdemannii]